MGNVSICLLETPRQLTPACWREREREKKEILYYFYRNKESQYGVTVLWPLARLAVLWSPGP